MERHGIEIVRMVTVPHTGTRWIASCFEASRVPLKWGHFPGDGDFSLLRDPRDVFRSWLKRGASASDAKAQLAVTWQLQREFIAAGGLAFSVHDDPLRRIGEAFGIALIDSTLRHHRQGSADIPHEVDEWLSTQAINTS